MRRDIEINRPSWPSCAAEPPRRQEVKARSLKPGPGCDERSGYLSLWSPRPRPDELGGADRLESLLIERDGAGMGLGVMLGARGGDTIVGAEGAWLGVKLGAGAGCGRT